MTQIIDAIYEAGILRPLQPLDIDEHTKVRLVLEVEDQRRRKAERILALARKSCEGLPEEKVSILQGVRLDATHFFSRRGDSE